MRRILYMVILLVLFVGCNSEPDIEPAKPVIYLYPEEVTDVTVTLDFDGELTYTYPSYEDEWNVKAYPDGRLVDVHENKEYSYLFWEGKTTYNWDFDEGFLVPGYETEEFLTEKLSYLGLMPNEYNEFIVYWVPRMKGNRYNLISFMEDDYEEIAALTIDPEPDSILRVFMVYKVVDEPIEVQEQEISTFVRSGFTVIEWGGAELIH